MNNMKQENIEEVLNKQLSIAHMINLESIEMLKNAAQFRTVQKGQIMQRDHNECTGVPFVLSGTLRLFTLSEMGREMNIYRIKEGEICLLAALCILTNKPYDFMVSADETTEVMIVNASIFKELIQRNPSFNHHILSLLADKLIHALALHEKVHLTSVNQKLMDYLYENANDSNILNTTHSQIAKDLGTSRVVISREIAKLRDEGLVETSRNKIKLIKK